MPEAQPPPLAASPFRTTYLRYEDLTAQLKLWAKQHPEFVRLTSLVKTPEGRDLWLLTVGRDPDRIRPAAWVDGNMHAGEFAGSSVALAIAEAFIRTLASPSEAILDLPSHLLDVLRDDLLLYVVPRLSPDGVEKVLATGAYVRSNPRDERLGRSAPFWRSADVDGDGQARLMRRIDPAGDFVASPEHPGLMLPRRVEDEGPFYTLYPEGFVENWDGFTVPGADDYLADNATDLNRNFPFSWAPEPYQKGAGPFAMSEPEARAVVEFATAHPSIFAWLNLHTFGGCYIRPSGDKPDKKMDQDDLSLFHQIDEWAAAFTSYPVVSGFEEFTYEPDKPLCGDLSSFAYAQRGAIGFVCELWDFWKQAGLTVHRPFVKNFDKRTRAEMVRIATWDKEHNEGRVVRPFAPFSHPQLGKVEIGGYDPRVGIWNPPPNRLSEVCDGQIKLFLRLMALAPRVRANLSVESIGAGVSRVSAVIENVGYLPTFFLSSAKGLTFNEPLRATLKLGSGLELASGDMRQDVGHLEGWGGFERPFTPAYARTSHGAVRRRVSWVVRGQGTVTLHAESVRVGRVEASAEVR